MIRLDELNALAPPDFVAQLAGIFEHSPWVAAGALAARPFNSRLQLLDAMRRTVQTADESAQLALIRAHPQLGARAANAPALTAASTREQRRAGLDACSGEQRQLLALLNAQYLAQFGFPFILAVRGHDPASIIACCKQRLTQTGASEQCMALTQIGQIAAYRLADLVVTAPEAEILAMRERLALAQQRSPLLREWMLAAGLEIWLDDAGALLGCRRGAMALSRRLLLGVELLGVEVDPRRLSLHSTGSLAVLTAIAVAQQLRQRALVLPFDMLLLSGRRMRVPGIWQGSPSPGPAQAWR